HHDFAGRSTRAEEYTPVHTRYEVPSINPDDLESVQVDARVGQGDRDVRAVFVLANLGAALRELVEAPLVFLEGDVGPGQDRPASRGERRGEYQVDPDDDDQHGPDDPGRNPGGRIRAQRLSCQDLISYGREPW